VASAAKWILDAYSAVVFAVAQVLREDDITTEGAASFEDRGVPVRDAEAPTCRTGGEHQLDVMGRTGNRMNDSTSSTACSCLSGSDRLSRVAWT
jgi:hypothetical protein